MAEVNGCGKLNAGVLTNRRKTVRIVIKLVVITVCATIAAAAYAHPGKVLRDGEITEAAIFEALKVDHVKAPSFTIRSVHAHREEQAPTTPSPGRTDTMRQAEISLLIPFDTNSALINPVGRSYLAVLARSLKRRELTDFNFVIEGHTDPHGGWDVNKRLSQSRAESVVNYLVGQHGLSARRLKAMGRAYTELMNTEDLTAPENRRVTIRRLFE